MPEAPKRPKLVVKQPSRDTRISDGRFVVVGKKAPGKKAPAKKAPAKRSAR